MKKFVYLTSILLFSFSTANMEPIDRLGIKGPIEFNTTSFSLVWSEKPNSNYYIQEYLPENETVERFNQLITVHVFDINVSIENAVQQKINELNKRKETDVVCNFEAMSSPDGKEIILDCLLSSSKNGELDIVEFIIYRYKRIELENNKNALLIYSYSKRGYGENILPFIKKLRIDRTDLIKSMSSIALPNIKLLE